MNRLAQETVPVWRALEGYDKAVLLRHETDIDVGALKFELSEKAEKLADVLDIPTKENLAKYLNELGDEDYIVDVFIFSHGWKDRFRVSKGTYGDNGTVTQRWLEANVRPLKIRIVWGTNCYGSTLNDCWANLGAKAASGAKFGSSWEERVFTSLVMSKHRNTFLFQGEYTTPSRMSPRITLDKPDAVSAIYPTKRGTYRWHPDFVVPHEDMILEVKGNYWALRHWNRIVLPCLRANASHLPMPVWVLYAPPGSQSWADIRQSLVKVL